MPEWMTPELWPVWCEARRGSFPRITRRAPGRRSRSARAVARPTMPPPTMAMSWVTAGSATASARRWSASRSCYDALDERPVRRRDLPRRLPVRVRHERRPRPLAVGEIVVRADVDELVRLADHRFPEADDPDPVLLEQVQRDLGEALLDVGHPSGHHVVGAVLVDHRAPPGWADSIVVADVIPSRREVRYAAHRLRWRARSSRSSRSGRRSVTSQGGRSPRPTTSSSPASR